MPTKKPASRSGSGRNGSKLLETLTGHKLNHASHIKGQGVATRTKHRQKISEDIFATLLPSLPRKEK